jgi:hypothetical protein
VKTLTFMCKSYGCESRFERPRSAIRVVKTWIYSTLSLDGGASPLHYWSAQYAVMEDFWSQTDLDAYASFHGATAVHSLRLKDEDADAFIAKLKRNSIDNSPQESEVG